jgi:peptidoglycan DL-endopeptidase CwlO
VSPSRRSIPLLLVLALSATLLAPVASAEPDTARLQELERELRQLEDQAAERRSELGALDARENELSNEQLAAEARLEEIEAELSLAVERYNEAVVALERVQADLQATLDELSALDAEILLLTDAVAGHARRLHKMGPSLEFAIVVGANGPADIGFRTSSLRQIISADQVSLERLGAATDLAAALEARLVEQEAAAAALAEEVEAQLIAVEQLYEDRAEELAALEATLAGVRRQVGEQQALVDADATAVTAARQAVAAEQERIEAERRRLEAERRAAREAEERRRAEQQRREEEAAAATRAAASRAASSSSSSSSSTSSSSSSSSSSSGPPSSGRSSSNTSSAPAPAPATRRSADVAIATALAQVGKPYRWGATGPNAFDCSGLTSYAWRAAGVTIPRTSGAQFAGLRRVTRAQLQPGDLVFYNSPISHVAMYVGGDTIVEASRTGIPVRTASLSRRSPVGYARP